MGWSWGTVLGFYMADKHPDQLYAYMTVSPAVKWLTIFNGETISDTTEFRKYFTDNSEMTALFKEANYINLTVSMPKVDCPVYFFVGRKDHQTNYLMPQIAL
jgi:pimeloyl-ACP methyl ester carboxylesterase